MVLVYVDETGLNYQISKETKFFKDGPFILYCGLIIPDSKYFHAERLFHDLIKKFLNNKDWSKYEIHGTDIFNGAGFYQKISESQRKQYFEELFQLFAKLRLDFIIGAEYKLKTTSLTRKKKQYMSCINSFIVQLEYYLSEHCETGIIISDDQSDNTLKGVVNDKTKWRYHSQSKKLMSPHKYDFENKSCFILDQVHHVPSNASLFIQMVDSVAFVVNRVFTHQYLINYPHKKVPPNIDKVPVTPATFKLYASSCGNFSAWNYQDEDVSNLPFHSFMCDEESYLPSSWLENLVQGN